MARKSLRERNFLAKFESAASELNATNASQVESLKFRGPTGFWDPSVLPGQLKMPNNEQIVGNYQGTAWKLTDADGNQIIVVSHETGLEILYLIGAMASIINLVALVAGICIRNRGMWPFARGPSAREGLEIRRLGANGRLVEEPVDSVDVVLMRNLLAVQDDLAERISALEAQVKSLTTLLKQLKEHSDDA